MKRKIISFVLAFVCVCSLCNVQAPTKVNAASYMNLNATAISKTQVKLTWKKKSVSSYKIYRATVNKNDTCGKFKKIATVSKSKVSYTNKVTYKQKYCYRIYGYKNGKKIYQGEEYVYSGVPASGWDEYQFCDAKISPTAIPLNWYAENGLKPTGYEIYRSENGKTYKKIKTLKNVNKYTDKTVQAKHTYYYKVRAYRTISGKKVYGKYSESVKHSAVNKNGIYSMDILPGDVASASAVSGSSVIAPILSSPASIYVVVSSDAMNANITMESGNLWDAEFTFKAEDGTEKTESGHAYGYIYQLKGDAWLEVEDENDVTIKPGETFYIRFDLRKDNMADMASVSAVTLDAYYGGITYNGFESLTSFTIPDDKTFTVSINGERYH